MLSKDIWPVAQFSRVSFDTTGLYVFAEDKLISNGKKVSFFFGTPVRFKKIALVFKSKNVVSFIKTRFY